MSWINAAYTSHTLHPVQNIFCVISIFSSTCCPPGGDTGPSIHTRTTWLAHSLHPTTISSHFTAPAPWTWMSHVHIWELGRHFSTSVCQRHLVAMDKCVVMTMTIKYCINCIDEEDVRMWCEHTVLRGLRLQISESEYKTAAVPSCTRSRGTCEWKKRKDDSAEWFPTGRLRLFPGHIPVYQVIGVLTLFSVFVLFFASHWTFEKNWSHSSTSAEPTFHSEVAVTFLPSFINSSLSPNECWPKFHELSSKPYWDITFFFFFSYSCEQENTHTHTSFICKCKQRGPAQSNQIIFFIFTKVTSGLKSESKLQVICKHRCGSRLHRY